MHKLYTLLFLCLAVSLGLQAQVTFSDNFDSYPADSYLGINNSKWTTWSGKPGTDEDAKVTSDKSKSPNNSVYIFAKDNAGGPMDLVLPFGQKFTKGTFIYRMNMFVPAKQTAYFNFQANEKIGDAWALNANFGTNGILALTNESTALMSTSFPIDEWFEIEFDINLSTNLWKLSINGDCKGSFANILNSIAYMDIFPTNKNCTFYIDDVYYEHTPTAKELVLDASIGGFTWNSTRLVGSTEEPTCFIQNNGSELINSATVVFSQTGQDDIEYELTDLALKTNQKSLIYLPEVTLSEGANLITVRITK
ncbi:MAG TPA: hypothetical protein PK611_10600, partial [Saprospiraceae bacterium]|nr:hypothetical protein [Saprospiraceae bacterium]